MLPIRMAFVKCLLVAFGVFYEISGSILLIKGAIEIGFHSKYNHFAFDQHYPMYFIILGLFMILFGLFGSYGAIKESERIILMFLILTAISDLAVLTHGIFTKFSLLSTYLHYDEVNVRRELIEGLRAFPKYREDWDNLQQMFNCCGIDHPDDWIYIFSNSSLPRSCSPSTLSSSSCLMGNETTGFHRPGCLPALIEHVRSDFLILIGVAWSKTILTLLTIISLSYVAAMGKSYARLIKTTEI